MQQITNITILQVQINVVYIHLGMFMIKFKLSLLLQVMRVLARISKLPVQTSHDSKNACLIVHALQPFLSISIAPPHGTICQ